MSRNRFKSNPPRIDVALVIPDDHPPKEIQLKRLLLNFESLLLIDPSDRYLHHEGEVQDEGGYHIRSGHFSQSRYISSTWNSQIELPRAEHFDDQFHDLVQAHPSLVQKRLVNLVYTRRNRRVNHFLNWHQTRTMAANQAIVNAAIPDGTMSEQEIAEILGVTTPQLSPAIDRYSRFWTPHQQVVNPTHAHPMWSSIAEGRIARFVKAQQLAFSSAAIPVGLSLTNIGIAEQQITQYTDRVPTDARGATLELSIFEESVLAQLLADCSWEEFLKIRSLVLPLVKKLRARVAIVADRHLVKDSRNHAILSEIETIQNEVDLLREEYADKVEKLRIGSILSLGGAVGGGGFLSAINVLPTTLSGFIVAISGGSLLALNAIKDELLDYAPARRKLLTHPLYGIERALGMRQ